MRDGSFSPPFFRRGFLRDIHAQAFQLSLDLRPQLCLRGQMEFITTGEYLHFLIFSECVLDNGIVFIRTQDQPKRECHFLKV